MKFVLLLIILFVIVVIMEKVINKLLRIEKQRISETPGKSINRWGRVIILISSLIALWFAIGDGTYIKLFWMCYFTMLLGFQAIMELIFLKRSKQYINTIISLIIGLILIYNIDFFLPF